MFYRHARSRDLVGKNRVIVGISRGSVGVDNGDPEITERRLIVCIGGEGDDSVDTVLEQGAYVVLQTDRIVASVAEQGRHPLGASSILRSEQHRKAEAPDAVVGEQPNRARATRSQTPCGTVGAIAHLCSGDLDPILGGHADLGCVVQ